MGVEDVLDRGVELLWGRTSIYTAQEVATVPRLGLYELVLELTAEIAACEGDFGVAAAPLDLVDAPVELQLPGVCVGRLIRRLDLRFDLDATTDLDELCGLVELGAIDQRRKAQIVILTHQDNRGVRHRAIDVLPPPGRPEPIVIGQSGDVGEVLRAVAVDKNTHVLGSVLQREQPILCVGNRAHGSNLVQGEIDLLPCVVVDAGAVGEGRVVGRIRVALYDDWIEITHEIA